MVNISTVKAKFNRLKNNLIDTRLYDEVPIDVINLNPDEKCIMYYTSREHSWILTNQNIILDSRKIKLKDINKIDFINLKEHPNLKTTNTQLNLILEKEKITFEVEPNSWHIVYNIFKYVISKSK